MENPDVCPEVFYPALNEALMQWELHPVEYEAGNNDVANFLTVDFKLTN